MTENTFPSGAVGAEPVPLHVTAPVGVQGLKEQFEAMSEQISVEWIGTLSDVIPREQFHGSVSIEERLVSGEVSQAEVDRAKQYIPNCYVPVAPKAGIRCVEDRNEEGYDDNNPASYQLGPQVQGGIIDVAVASRLTRGTDGGTTVIADIEAAIQEDTGEFTVSTHTDTAHRGDGEMGCGAQKGQAAKLSYYQDAAYMQSIVNLTRTIYDKAARTASSAALAALPHHAADLEAVPDYLSDLAQAGSYVAERTGNNPEARKVVEGTHKAAYVVLNFVEGETLNPGKLNVYTNSKIMSFGLDVWYILKAYPQDEATVLIADAVATLMNLTDGSLEVGLRLPQNQVADTQ